MKKKILKNKNKKKIQKKKIILFIIFPNPRMTPNII